MVISIEKEIDIDRVTRLFFSIKYDVSYRRVLDGISACFCSSSLNLSLQSWKQISNVMHVRIQNDLSV